MVQTRVVMEGLFVGIEIMENCTCFHDNLKQSIQLDFVNCIGLDGIDGEQDGGSKTVH